MGDPTLNDPRLVIANKWGKEAAAAISDSELAKLRNAGYTSGFHLRNVTHTHLREAGLRLANAHALLPDEGEALSTEASHKCDDMKAHRA